MPASQADSQARAGYEMRSRSRLSRHRARGGMSLIEPGNSEAQLEAGNGEVAGETVVRGHSLR